jgi:hypothetical protein
MVEHGQSAIGCVLFVHIGPISKVKITRFVARLFNSYCGFSIRQKKARV